LWNFLDIIHNNVTHPIFQDVKAVFIQSLPLLLIFITLVILNQWTKRFWCRYLCPLGGLLGLLSKFALIRRQVGNECSECALCLPACPVDTINPENGFNSDPAECTVCYDCIVACKKKDNAFQWQLTNWKVAEKQEYDIGRRQAIKAFGVAALGVTLAGIETITIREPSIFIRPPGARSTSFDSLCIRCGECVRVCPTQGLQPTLFEAGWQNIFTPQLVPRLGACSFSCNQCGIVCPSGAIPALSLEEKQKTSIGLARVDKNRCLPWAYNTACIVCEESCPLPEKAITLEKIEYQDQDGQPQSIQCPSVVKNRCIGCGICEYQCPMGGESAIRVYTYTEASNIQVQ
jgi:MauM/NapG family ferredoxin protein